MPSNYLAGLRSAFRQGIQRSFVGPEGGLQDSLVVIVGQGKLLLGNSRLFHSVPGASFAGLNVFLEPSTIVAAQSNLHLVNRRKNITVVGALSRTFSIPSVSGPSFQVCGYHVDRLLSEPNHLIEHQKVPMAVSGSRALLGDCSSVHAVTSRRGSLVGPTSGSFATTYTRSFDNCRKACMSLRNDEHPNNHLLYGYFIYHVAKTSGISNPAPGFGMRSFHISAPACFSAGTAPDVTFDNPAREEQAANSTDSSEQYVF